MTDDRLPESADPAPLPDPDVYPAVGEDGFNRLVAAFYRRVRSDDLLGPMYPPQDMAGAELRLRDFLIFRFGGPHRYIAARGHPRLRMRHGPFTIGRAARDRWVQLMEQSLAEADLPPAAAVTLRRFFLSTATFMINQG